MQPWTRHSPHTDPGEYAAALATIGPAPGRIVAAVQGLLIHGEAVERYGLVADAFSRSTLPVAKRLGQILTRDARPLDEPRAPQDRAVGTCRDYAQLTCAALRCHGQPARVRCGFAAYFGPAWEDHWICEWWNGGRWRRIDAQLDAVTREALGIAFDPEDLPPDAYIAADAAWRLARDGRIDPDCLRHGDEARGLWFAFVNLQRDACACRDEITSDFDAWRETAANPPKLTREDLEDADTLMQAMPLASPY